MDIPPRSRGDRLRTGTQQRRLGVRLRLNPPWNLRGITTELFDDAMQAFQRHAAIERVLIDEGWMLEGFECHWRDACCYL